MRLPVPVETERLRLRPLREEDAELVVRMSADPDVRRFTGGVRGREDALAGLAVAIETGTPLAIETRDQSRPIGYAGLRAIDGTPHVELFYGLAPEAWGRGYATEAARAVLEAGFRSTDLPRAVSVIDPDNQASIRVIEKVGLTRSGELFYPPHDRTYPLWAVDRRAGVERAFDRFAARYDRSRRQLIPCFDALYEAALEQLPFARQDPVRVLDLGAGTGVLSARVAHAFPRAELELVDVSAEMLDRAHERLSGQPRVRFRRADYLEAELGGPWDAVVSALSIHHAADADKRALFGRVRESLTAGGVFVNADQVVADQESWLAAVRSSGVPEDDLSAALERMREDRCAGVEDQLEWMAEAGLRDATCCFRAQIFAVFGARL